MQVSNRRPVSLERLMTWSQLKWRRIDQFALLGLGFFLVLGCRYLQLPEHLQSEAATENPNPTFSDATVFLNNQDSGRISDIGRQPKPLSPNLGAINIEQRLAEIMTLREDSGVLLDGNLAASNVYLVVNSEISVRAFAKLYVAVDQAAGIVYVPKDPYPGPPAEPTKPSPFFLAVHTERVDGARTYLSTLPDYDPEFNFSYDIEVEIAKSAEQLKRTRMWEHSFEISADERFFINEKQGPDADYGPRYSRVKQRPIDEAQAKDELSRLPTSDRKLIIVSEKASYGKLLTVFALSEPRTRFRIVVRPNSFLQR